MFENKNATNPASQNNAATQAPNAYLDQPSSGRSAALCSPKRDIRKIMSKEAAEKVLNDIKNNLCEVDLDELCSDEITIDRGENEILYKRVLQAIMCGLVFWDDKKNIMVQKLINPIKSNEITIEELEYKYPIKLGQVKGMNAKNDADVLLQSLAIITGRGKHALEGLRGRDNEIAAGCFSFFDR